ncbi:MAG TPA: hypothetical protein VGA37_13940 [Gemmatimonadales bacterium]
MTLTRTMVFALALFATGCATMVYTVGGVMRDDSAAQREAVSTWLIARGYGLEYRNTPDGPATTAWTITPNLLTRTRHVLTARRRGENVENVLDVTLETGPAVERPIVTVDATTWRLADGLRMSQIAVSAEAREDASALIAAFSER